LQFSCQLLTAVNIDAALPCLLRFAAADERVDDDIEIEGGPQLAPNAKCPITAKPVGWAAGGTRD